MLEYPARRTALSAIWNGGDRVRALDGVSVTLAPGEIVAVLGPNGAGKSTLLRLAAALLTPVRGSVTIAGIAATDRAAARARVGFADGGGLSPRLSVRENLRLAAALYGVTESAPRIAELAALFEIEPLLDARVQTLSHGEQTRVALARSLLHRPALVLIDEQFTALDPGAAARFRARLFELASRESVAALVATHDLALAGSLTRALVLDRGRVVADGPFGKVESNLKSIFGLAKA